MPQAVQMKAVMRGRIHSPSLAGTRPCSEVCAMSALAPKADVGTQPRDVRFVPKADIRAASFDHLVGDRKQIG